MRFHLVSLNCLATRSFSRCGTIWNLIADRSQSRLVREREVTFSWLSNLEETHSALNRDRKIRLLLRRLWLLQRTNERNGRREHECTLWSTWYSQVATDWHSFPRREGKWSISVARSSLGYVTPISSVEARLIRDALVYLINSCARLGNVDDDDDDDTRTILSYRVRLNRETESSKAEHVCVLLRRVCAASTNTTRYYCRYCYCHWYSGIARGGKKLASDVADTFGDRLIINKKRKKKEKRKKTRTVYIYIYQN